MIGRQLGHYEIVDKLGEGGMGEVYRARDPRLDRDVAIKVLPPDRLENAEARSRFQREAKAVAALSHPNILAIHDVGQQDDQVYLVMELLEGRSLQEELAAGPLSLRSALDLAAQVADGLAAAHERGIIHRDIKPANLFLMEDGRVKILDFGLAKATQPESVQTTADTIRESTEPGRVMGTVRYMSPEQARAQPLDHRSDIFSLGTVLWESTTGRSAFQGDSAVEIMNAILKEDLPDLSSQSDGVPPAVDRIIRRCLEKNPARRFQSAQDLAFALRNSLDSSSHSTPAIEPVAAPPSTRLRVLVGAAVLLLAGGLGGALIANLLREPEFIEPAKIVQFTQSGGDWAPSASPDGQIVAFASNRDGIPRIWLRQVKSGVEAPLTEGPDASPRFAPDGSSILFVRGDLGGVRSAQRVPVVGGPPRRLIDDIWEVCWSPDGSRLGFTRSGGDGKEPATLVGIADLQSGASRILTTLPLRFGYGLDWSPDGRWLTLSSNSAIQNVGDQTIELIDAETGERRSVVKAQTQLSAPKWTPDGKSLLFARSTSLLGDVSSPLGRLLQIDPSNGRTRVLFWVQSVWAGAGDYSSMDFLDPRTLVFDEILWSGNLTTLALEDGAVVTGSGRHVTVGNSRDRQPAFSPDGRQIVFSSNRSGNLDLWLVTPETGEVRQLTDDAAEDWDPAFTPDGQEILWSSNRGGHLEIWRMSVHGSNARQISNDGVDAENPSETPDGKWIVYGSGNPARSGIWMLPTGGGEEVQLRKGSYLLPEISPDGRYVLFVNIDPQLRLALVQVSEIETREQVFQTSAMALGLQSMVQPGRARWMPDGKSFAFVGVLESGASVLYAQDFVPGTETEATRRELTRSDAENPVESFGISPDGSTLVQATIQQFRTIKIADIPALAER